MVASAVFMYGAMMVLLDPQLLPASSRKMLTLWTKTDRSRKILGAVWMVIGALFALDAVGVFAS